MSKESSGSNSPPFDKIRSQQSVVQVEIHTRKSILEGFTWVLGTNKEGALLGQEFYDKGFLPFDNNPLRMPSRGVDIVTINTTMAIDPSGRQSPNAAEVILNENILVYAKYNVNQTSQDGFLTSEDGLNQKVGDVTAEALTSSQSPGNRNIRGATQESGAEVRSANIININYKDSVNEERYGWMRLKYFLETELEPDDRIVIKTLSHKHLPFVGDNWEAALEPIFTGYINSIVENGVVGGDELITLSCKCNLHYLEISKFNIAPTFMPSAAADRKLNRFFDKRSALGGLESDIGSGLYGSLYNNKENTTFSDLETDLLLASDELLKQVEFSPSFGLNELVNESATTLMLRLLTADAFETVPVLDIKRKDGSLIQYYLQSGVTTQQLSYNNILGPFGADNAPLRENRVDGPNGRLETIVALPFFNSGLEMNSSINQFYGEWNTVLDLCGAVANSVEAEFFADEAGKIVFKFPTHGVGINLLPNNDILPNPYAGGGKVPLVLQDQEIISWNFTNSAPALTVIKASAGSGMSSISDETFLLQNVAIVRFDGTMTLGGLPIGGGENLINKYGIRAQSLPPTNIYLPGNPTTDGAQNKLLRATIAQYAIMKAEAVNDIARHTGTVTAIEDSAFKIGQPMIYEPRLRDGDYSDQFGFPRREFYYIQGIQRNISVGQTPTMTLSLTVGRRYPELSGFERAYFSFYQYIVRRHPHNSLLVYPDTSIPSSDMISDFEKDAQSFNSIDSQSSFMDQIKANFGQNADGAFFTIDPETENVTGPTKDRLISITGDSGSSSKDGKPMDTRIITRRSYRDLETQINDLTKLSSGWNARAKQPVDLIFTRSSRRQEKDARVIKSGDFESIIEPLLKVNIDILNTAPNVDADAYPEPQPAISDQFQGVTDSKLLFERILNEQINIS